MIIGTAGHIDHGKTALVRALTGIDTDRLPEEKRRGITIALGFAPLVLAEIGTVGIVDVPGHEAFVRTMLAGASGIDCALLVVAADEGVMPQTREHLHVLQLLGVTRGVVALTKCDVADVELQDIARLDLKQVLASSSIAAAPIVAVSALTGRGIEELRAELAKALKQVPGRDESEPFRMPVDRVFSVAGAGTVVTGTTWSGSVRVGEALRFLPAEHAARLRSVETHGHSVEASSPGARTAMAVAGVDRDDVHPGDVVVRAADAWVLSRILRADVTLLDGAPLLGPRTQLRFHLGTAERGARIVATGGPVAAGTERAVRVLLDAPVVARAGDRFVLRGGSPHTTIGGGVISDPLAPTARARPFAHTAASPAQRLTWMLSEAGKSGVDLPGLVQRLGLSAAAVAKLTRAAKGVAEVGGRLYESTALERLRAELLAMVSDTHRAQPLSPGLDRQTARSALRAAPELVDEVIRRAERAGLVEAHGSVLRAPGFDPSSSATAGTLKDAVFATLEAAGTEPPATAEIVAAHGKDAIATLKLLEREGLLVPVSIERPFAASAVRQLLAALRSGTNPERRYTPSELREILGISRKYLIPFLEWCDRRGISRRTDAGRTFPAVPEHP